MSLAQGYHRVIRELADAIAIPPIERLLLPLRDADNGKPDEFGFLLLADGSVGPFYVSLGDSLATLDRWLLENGGYRGADAVRLALTLGDASEPANALALGAVNAISQYLFRKAGFDPAAVEVEQRLIEPTGSIGMVGYFGSIAERYLAQGRRIVVVEKNPGRIPTEMDIEVSTDPQVLAGCDYVICTASTLINNTLDEILASVSATSLVHLMGPSASCLPDPLFAAGIDIVGGIIIGDAECLQQALEKGESWGDCGRKYQLSTASYPGLEALIQQTGRS